MTSQELRVLVLEGPPRECGRIHGETLRPEIKDLLTGWKEGLGKDTGFDPEAYLAQFLQETDFLQAITRWTPDLLEEVQGIAEGAGADFNTILAHQLPDEEWWCRREFKRRQSEPGGEHCSGLGVFGQADGSALIAQNMDVPIWYDGYQTLLRIQAPGAGLETLVFTAAGLIALNGLNDHSVGVCVNTLLQLNYTSDGLPVAFAVRGALAQGTHADAVAFVQRIKHASGQNFIVGGPQAVLDFECSANQVVPFIPYPGAKRVYHTNHPLANADQELFKERLKHLSPQQQELLDESRVNTETRFHHLETQLGDASETINVERVKAILSAHEGPVCVDRENGRAGLTLGCTIMELSPLPQLHLAPGPPCSTAFETFRF